MKEPMGIRVISVDPLPRTSDFDNATELKGFNSRRPQYLKKEYEKIRPAKFSKYVHFHF